MQSIICFVFLAVTLAIDNKPQYDLKDAPALFEKFMKDYNRHYKDEADKNVHYEAFVESLKFIIDANKAHPSATFDINKFSDYTMDEWAKMTGLV
ncbi:unnamed protein product, partial [Brenthis ino]